MSRPMMELDLFGMEKQMTSSKSQFQKFLDRRQSFRGFQGAISKISPDIIKSLIGSGSSSQRNGNGNLFDYSCKSVTVPSIQNGDQPRLPFLPGHSPITRPSAEKIPETAPLTIFYNGKVSVFEVPRETAESIMKLAIEGSSKKHESGKPTLSNPSKKQQKLFHSLGEDLPIPRRKSLQTFLEKRRERLTSACPYSSKT